MKKLAIYDINRIIISDLKRDYYKDKNNIERSITLFSKSCSDNTASFSTFGELLYWKNGMYTFKIVDEKLLKM